MAVVLRTHGVMDLDGMYFPRDIIIRKTDISVDRPLYLFVGRRLRTGPVKPISGSPRAAQLVYENAESLISASRVPSMSGRRGPLQVYRLVRKDSQ